MLTLDEEPISTTTWSSKSCLTVYNKELDANEQWLHLYKLTGFSWWHDRWWSCSKIEVEICGQSVQWKTRGSIDWAWFNWRSINDRRTRIGLMKKSALELY